jgi:hypothetical protein
MADAQILASGTSSAPLDYVVPGAQEILVKVLSCSYDGSGAGGPWVPAVTLLAPGGREVGTFVLGQTLAAGASADVSWFSGVGNNTTTINTGGTTLDYVEITVPVFVTGTVGSPTPILTGNSVTYDGISPVFIEVYTTQADVQGQGNIITSLYQDSTDLARLSQTDINNPGTIDMGGPFYGARFLTPPAGAHTYSVKGWTTTPASNPFFQAGVGHGGSTTNYMPAFMRISAANLV